jgi:GDA1/CD39 (nucleoside phosphatase) family
MLIGARNFLVAIGADDVPIYLLGTQGMRNLEDSDREAGRAGDDMLSVQVLGHVHEVMNDERGNVFRLGGAPDSNDHDRSARIISGKQEGVLAWVAVNYGFEKRNPDIRDQRPENTIAIFELGGASMQIAFDIKRSYPGLVKVCLPSGHHYIHAASSTNYGVDSMRRRLMPNTNQNGTRHECVRTGDRIRVGDVIYRGTGSTANKWTKYVFSYNFFD